MKPQKDQGNQERQGATGRVFRLMVFACPLQMLHSNFQVHNLQDIRVVDKVEMYDFINEAKMGGLRSSSIALDQGQRLSLLTVLYLLYYTTCDFLSDDFGLGIRLDLATIFLDLLDKNSFPHTCTGVKMELPIHELNFTY